MSEEDYDWLLEGYRNFNSSGEAKSIHRNLIANWQNEPIFTKRLKNTSSNAAKITISSRRCIQTKDTTIRLLMSV